MKSGDTLIQALLQTVVKYTPVFGSAFPISESMSHAFIKYPRHMFIDSYRHIGESRDIKPRTASDSEFFTDIYSNKPLMYVSPTGNTYQSSSSEPAFIMQLLSALDVRAGDRVLEIGCGTGWLLAMIAALSGSGSNVVGVEIVSDLVCRAKANLLRVGLDTVNVIAADGNTLNDSIGLFDRIIYTASSFHFPEYLFKICKLGGIVVLPIRNKGLAEEVYVLKRTETGFRSVAARLCKFVQMTRDFGTDSSGIRPAQTWLQTRLHSGSTTPCNIPGGVTGALAFSSFMSKTNPEFWVLGLSDPAIAPSLSAGFFGDPAAIGLALLANDDSGGAVWNRGVLRGFGSSSFVQWFREAVAKWEENGQPVGAQFTLHLQLVKSKPPSIAQGLSWHENRGNTTFTWSLNL